MVAAYTTHGAPESSREPMMGPGGGGALSSDGGGVLHTPSPHSAARLTSTNSMAPIMSGAGGAPSSDPGASRGSAWYNRAKAAMANTLGRRGGASGDDGAGVCVCLFLRA